MHECGDANTRPAMSVGSFMHLAYQSSSTRRLYMRASYRRKRSLGHSVYKSNLAPEGDVAASPLFVGMMLVLPFAACLIAFGPWLLHFACFGYLLPEFDPQLLHLVRNVTLLLPGYLEVEKYPLVHTLPFLHLQLDSRRHDQDNGPQRTNMGTQNSKTTRREI